MNAKEGIIIGADIGHNNGKICYCDTPGNEYMFKSTSMVNDRNRITDDKPLIVSKIGSIEYAVGSKYGVYSIEENKAKDEVFKVCLYTGIAKLMQRNIETINLVTGLPVNYFKKYKQELTEELEGNTISVIVDGETKVINFETVDVYPESVGAILVSGEKVKGTTLIIDIGGRTVDVSYFEGTKLVKTGSYDLGMLTLYSKIIKYINEHFIVDYESAAEDIIKNRFIEVNNECLDFNCDRFMEEHTEDILRRVRLDFPWKTSKKRFIGGGSVELASFIKKSVDFDPNITKDGIYLNSRAFYLIGAKKYGR